MKARPLFVLARVGNGELSVRQRSGKPRDRNFTTRGCRPLAAPCQATGKDTDVVGVIRDRKWNRAQVVERRRRAEWRNNPTVVLGDDAQWGKMNLPCPIHRRNDGLSYNR